MDSAISINADSEDWAVAVRKVVPLLIVCVTVVILARQPNGVEKINAFADVIRR